MNAALMSIDFLLTLKTVENIVSLSVPESKGA
jgi:hypothetical protein